MQGSGGIISAFFSRAVFFIISRTFSFVLSVDITTAEFSFIIPALWEAISSTVFPKIAVWSSDIEVITETKGGKITLVQSRSPPIPVSRITISHFSRSNQRKAIAIVISNCEYGLSETFSETNSHISQKEFSSISLLFMRILSV